MLENSVVAAAATGNGQQDEGQVEPSPQLRISTPVDEVYHSIGSANDIIVVEGAGGTFYVTDFSVRIKEGTKLLLKSLMITFLSTFNRTACLNNRLL